MGFYWSFGVYSVFIADQVGCTSQLSLAMLLRMNVLKGSHIYPFGFEAFVCAQDIVGREEASDRARIISFDSRGC